MLQSPERKGLRISIEGLALVRGTIFASDTRLKEERMGVISLIWEVLAGEKREIMGNSFYFLIKI